MGKWSREEIEAAFENYPRCALDAGRSGNWDKGSELFTEDDNPARFAPMLKGYLARKKELAAKQA